jgi:hypothetical protein
MPVRNRTTSAINSSLFQLRISSSIAMITPLRRHRFWAFIAEDTNHRIERPNVCFVPFSVHAHYSFDTMSASFATVFMLRAVPDLAAGIFSFERPIPLP